MVFNGKIQYWIPYSIGCLWSYSLQFDWVKEYFNLKDLIFTREEISSLLDRIVEPKICGFSCYVWNEQYCLTVAKAIKERWPTCVIVFGGPQVHTDTLKHTFVDNVILGEGEEAWVTILDSILYNKPIKQIFANQRMSDLTIPSPYTSKVFDQIVKNNPDAVWQMTIETNRGCPYQCTFCDWGSLTYSKIKKFSIERVQGDLTWAANNPVTYIYCADANFGIFKDRDLEIANIISETLKDSVVDTVNLQYAKNSTEIVFEIAKILGKFNRGVTVSLQSLNIDTLTEVKRKNLKINDTSNLLNIANKNNILTYTELILGLPEETLESWKQGLANLLELGQHQSIEVWFAQVLKNSEMATLNYRLKNNIKTITVHDYFAMYNDPAETINEYIDIINQTNTMSTEELIEAYMYAWLVIHFHVSGYTQIYAKFARANGISYQTFNDKLYNEVISIPEFNEHYTTLKTGVFEYLTLSKPFFISGHAMHAYSFEFMYKQKELIFSMGLRITNELLNFSVPTEVIDLQKYFIYDVNTDYPISLHSSFNPLTCSVIPTQLQIDSKIKTNFNFYSARRIGLLKNIVRIIDTT